MCTQARLDQKAKKDPYDMMVAIKPQHFFLKPKLHLYLISLDIQFCLKEGFVIFYCKTFYICYMSTIRIFYGSARFPFSAIKKT